MTDKERIAAELLALRCRRGDDAALRELVRTWEKRLFYYIRRLAPDEESAWDILQETWMRVLKDIGKLENPRSLGPWLYTIARRRVMDHLRLAYAEPAHDAEDIEPEEIAAPEPDDFDAEQVHDCLARLSTSHREALTLHFLEDFTVEEIAGILDIPPGTVKSRLFHARRALRAIMERGA